MRPNRVAFKVLTNRSLFVSIVAFSSGVSYYIFHLKRTLQCVKQQRTLAPADVKLVQNAISSGDRHILSALLELLEFNTLGLYFPMLFNEMMGFAVTHTKDLKLLNWIYDNFTKDKHRRVAWDQSELLGEQGDIEVAKWAKDHEYRVSACGAAKCGHLELITYLHEAGDQDFSVTAMDAAATNGHLNIVQFLHENRTEGCTHVAMEGAAKNGHLQVLTFLHENRNEGCVANAIRLAVIGGHVRCVKYLFEANSEGIPRAELVNSAATRGHLECIKFFHSNEHFLFNANTMHYAAVGNHLAIVKFLHKHRNEGCKVETLFECDKRGLPQVVEFLCLHRPMANVASVVARAKQEGRFLLAAKLERGARTVKTTYAYK